MKQLVLMYVYFDKNGDIKAITPSKDCGYAEYEHIMVPLSEVEPFIVGKKNSFDYIIKPIEKVTGTTYKLIKKFTSVNLTRTLDNYLTLIPGESKSIYIVKIVADNKQKKIAISLNKDFKQLYEDGAEEDKDKIDEFLNSGKSGIYITEKNNPYRLITSIEFSPKVLFDRLNLILEAKVDLRNSSAYTKRLIDGYVYIVKE